MFFTRLQSTKEVAVVQKCLCKSRKKCCSYLLGYLYYLLNKQKILHLFGLCIYSTSDSVVFKVRVIISLNDGFSSIFLLAGLVNSVFKDLLLNMRISVLYDKNFSPCFNSQLVALQLCMYGATPLSLRIIIVCQGLGCFHRIFKVQFPI